MPHQFVYYSFAPLPHNQPTNQAPPPPPPPKKNPTKNNNNKTNTSFLSFPNVRMYDINCCYVLPHSASYKAWPVINIYYRSPNNSTG